MWLAHLVEDNAPGHWTVQRVNKEKWILQGIVTFNRPFKSPDLNQIVPIWCDQKDEIATYQFTGASQTSTGNISTGVERASTSFYWPEVWYISWETWTVHLTWWQQQLQRLICIQLCSIVYTQHLTPLVLRKMRLYNPCPNTFPIR